MTRKKPGPKAKPGPKPKGKRISPGSGRRRLRRISPDLQLPPLGDDEKSIRAYITAVNGAVAASQLDPRTADTLTHGATSALRTVEIQAEREDLPEYRRILAEAKELERMMQAREAAERLGGGSANALPEAQPEK